MDPRDDGSRRSRGVPNRMLQWAGRTVNKWLESDSDQSSSSRPSHHQTAHQPAEWHGQIPISPAESDHLRLLFKASPLPCSSANAETNTTSHAVLAPVDSTSCSPYPPAINIVCVDFLGEVHSATTYVKRDLGFQGQLGSYILLSYGDTLYTDANYSDTWRGMTSDSIALATHDPLVVVDPVLNEQGYPPQFCPLISNYGEDPADCALGITNVVQTGGGGSGGSSANENEGVMFFLLNHRPNGTNNLVGAGVASVSLDMSSYPPVAKVRRLAKYWWDATLEPWYGDICALRHDGYVYAYGHGGHASENPWVYLARARLHETTVLGGYEYWNGDGWQSERLMTKQLGEKESVFWQVNQGQVVWSAWLGCFVFVYCDNWMNSKVLMKTAQKPEGPWSEQPIEVYQATPLTEGGAIYAAVPHDYYDKTGRTLVVTFTNHPNRVQAVKVTFG